MQSQPFGMHGNLEQINSTVVELEMTPKTTLGKNESEGKVKNTEQKPTKATFLRKKIISLGLFLLIWIMIIPTTILIGSKEDEMNGQSALSTTLTTKASIPDQEIAVVQELQEVDNYVVDTTTTTIALVCKGLKGDGICDDMCNTMEYEFDQGDCCLTGDHWGSDCVQCQCFNPKNHTTEVEPSNSECYVQPEEPLQVDLDSLCNLMINDGLCDDLCNNPEQVISKNL